VSNETWWYITGIVTSGTVVLLMGRRLWQLLKDDDDPWADR
jgi:hypothetical protein